LFSITLIFPTNRYGKQASISLILEKEQDIEKSTSNEASLCFTHSERFIIKVPLYANTSSPCFVSHDFSYSLESLALCMP
jgi:hypothetical protein